MGGILRINKLELGKEKKSKSLKCKEREFLPPQSSSHGSAARVFIKPKVIKSLLLCQCGLKKTPAFHELMSNCFSPDSEYPVDCRSVIWLKKH